MDSLTETPITFWLSVCQIVFLTLSSLIFSIQRAYNHRHINLNQSLPLKRDTERDVVNTPFANGNRLNRLNFETLILAVISAYVFYIQAQQQQQPQHDNFVFSVIGSAFTFVTCAYCLVLSLTAIRYPLPNSLGWTLNVHLFALYLVLWISSIGNVLVSWYQTSTVPLISILPVIFAFDLVYTTATVKKGSPFLDENGKPVNGINVESIIGTLYFNWLTPIINMIYSKGKDLTDDDLPRLPIKHRSFNIFYYFGASRGKGLIYRLYIANRASLITQVSLSVLIAFVMYGQPLFLNRLLLLIQEISVGGADDRSLVLGLGYIIGMSIFNIVDNLVIAQMWFYGKNVLSWALFLKLLYGVNINPFFNLFVAQSSVQIRIKSMLNIELYRKTLRRMDTSILSGKKKTSKSETKDKKDSATASAAIEEDDVSSATGLIVNLMSTDATRIAAFSSQFSTLVRAPAELVFGTYFLYCLLGWSSIVGLMVIVVTLPINHFNTKWFIKVQAQLMKSRDKRVSLMNEVLQGIRQIKFFAWESNWSKRILDSRNAELGYLKKTFMSEVVFLLLWQGVSFLFMLIVYTISLMISYRHLL